MKAQRDACEGFCSLESSAHTYKAISFLSAERLQREDPTSPSLGSHWKAVQGRVPEPLLSPCDASATWGPPTEVTPASAAAVMVLGCWGEAEVWAENKTYQI